jgi:uncharacterized protein (DUF2461 family)
MCEWPKPMIVFAGSTNIEAGDALGMGFVRRVEHPMRFSSRFNGFTEHTVQFIADSKRNNGKDCPARRQHDYLVHVMEPAMAFVSDMGSMLARIYPGIVADPSPDGSILGIRPDGLFTNGTSSKNARLSILFWQSPGEKTHRPGFCFELDQRGLRLYYGWRPFSPAVLRQYRDAVADDRRGNDLLRVIRTLKKSGIKIGGQFYDQVPHGWLVGPARAELIRHNALYAELDCGMPDVLCSGDLVEYCVHQWKRVRPLYEWGRVLG